MSKEVFRRMVMFSPEILDDLYENDSISSNTLGSLTHAVGSAQMSANPFVKNRDRRLQEEAAQADFVRPNMFGQGVPGGKLGLYTQRFQQLVQNSQRGRPKVNEPKNPLFNQYK